MRPPYIVALGASAGGMEPLLAIINDLPRNLDAAVLVVVHVPSSGPSALPRVLGRRAGLPVRHAVDGDRLAAGEILIAPPDHHLTIEDSTVQVRRGPIVNRTRPAIDPLFQSVALHAAERGIGVVLSGALDDGAAGLAAIAEAGGTAIVQDPAEAMYRSMPEAAMELAAGTHRLPASRIAGAIVERTSEPPGRPGREPGAAERLEKELGMSDMDPEPVTTDELGAGASVYGCPACGGTLWELRESDGFRFRCRVGHAYSPRTLLEAESTNAEDGLWIAYRALDEQASLALRLAEQAHEKDQEAARKRFLAQARRAERQARAVRDLLRTEPGTPAPRDEPAVDSRAEGERAESTG